MSGVRVLALVAFVGVFLTSNTLLAVLLCVAGFGLLVLGWE
jgi:hypothetical protein